ncbi:hypothetical protein, partial [Jatrophihabitans endophyticus]|uniref:hypothetical protein n=1 Tax=Jatrophihabitans endophyticus TaxID=1206085 RepID=UPI0019F434D0
MTDATHGAEVRLVPPATWGTELRREFERDQYRGVVGSRLVSETDRVRVWWLRLVPGERIGFHRHVLPYFWTCVTGGRGRSNATDGSVLTPSYGIGETRHLDFGPGEFMVHDLQNVGDTELLFTTVEFLDGPNRPLPVPA